jgi:hypothetical protein
LKLASVAIGLRAKIRLAAAAIALKCMSTGFRCLRRGSRGRR